MKSTLLALCLLSPAALACGDAHLPLTGTATVPTCVPDGSAACVYAGQATRAYMEKVPDSDVILTIGLQSSPWRMYDGDLRILTVDDLAAALRPKLDGKVRGIELIGSWTGVSPQPGTSSLADRLSKALDGFAVKGEDGFLWLAADGSRRTTRQAYTLREGAGAYFLPEGEDVMVALADGWPAMVEDQVGEDEPDMLMRVAVAKDVFMLCPDEALAAYERAAGKGSAIAAYNAALMRLERNADGDRDAALVLLQRGAALGDARSQARWDAERASKAK
ncbi:MAG: hypothetical protein E6Q50_16560 [Lysobacter sp.]|nr:MAG: hypothetical protein E6Q50_16560 [Lysobacter sp.]